MNLANRITLLRMLLIPAFLIVAFYTPFFAAFIYLIAAITDSIDGHIARKHNQITKFGIFVDPIADKLLVVAGLVILLPLGRVTPVAVFIILAREFIVTGLRLVAASDGVNIAADKLAKVKSVLQSVFIVAALIENWPISLFLNIPIYQIMEWVAVLFTVWSGIDYFVKYWTILDIKGEQSIDGRDGNK